MSYLLDLSIISNIDYEGSDIQKLDIKSYEMVSYEKQTLKIQVDFIHPEYISLNFEENDRLRVFFKETWFFVDELDRQSLPEGTILTMSIGRQFKIEELEELEQLDK